MFAHQRRIGVAAAVKGHAVELYIKLRFQNRPPDIRQTAHAGGADGNIAGIRFRRIDQILQALVRGIGVGNHDSAFPHVQQNRNKVIVIQVRRAHGMEHGSRLRTGQQRIAVCRLLSDIKASDRSAGPGFIGDGDGLA